MFRKTSPMEFDLFTSPSSLLGKRAAKKYDFPTVWHNMFFQLVTSRIDESIFKEGFGCSDEDLFEKCEFDMLTRKAIGLVNLDTAAPSIDTYYLFRRRICEYDTTHKVNLMERCFESITGEQIKRNNIEAAMFQYNFYTRNNKTRHHVIIETLLAGL